MNQNWMSAIGMMAVIVLAGACAGDQRRAPTWQNPIKKRGYLNSPLVETTPFVFKGDLYVLEFWRLGLNWPDTPGGGGAADRNESWIARLPDGPAGYAGRRYIAPVLSDHALGTAIVHRERVYVFAVDERSQRTRVDMTWSDDLKTWSKPTTVLTSPHGRVYNVAVTADSDGFAFLWETDGVGTPFTLCYGRIDSLTDSWNEGIIPDAVYGRDKYTGGPALYHHGGWYYTLYLEQIADGYETRITRSRDLRTWNDAPADRPFLAFDPAKRGLPKRPADVAESNASDAELCFFNGRTVIFFTGGDQVAAGDLQWAEYDGPPGRLLQWFFAARGAADGSGGSVRQAPRNPIRQDDRPVYQLS